ncbi:MAG: TonB-dependent receptor [Epsilonproteobacteria bacterium]|nr:hypothetical protein [Campylobacterota bacterium]NPA56495.1 TonB-dependent receptor [Campylobacterota bacterium]
MKTEAKVGLFVALGLLFLFLLSTQVNRFANMGKKGYEIYALLEDASGLDKNAKVKIKGVDVGFVKDIGLEGRKVKAVLFIYDGVKIPKDSIVTLQQESLLGTKYLAIEPGKSEEYLGAGEALTKEKLYVSFDQTSTTINEAAQEFKAFISELRESIKGASGEDLKKSVENLQRITEHLRELIEQNRENIAQSIENIKEMGLKLSEAGEKFGRMSDKFALTADNINQRLPSIMRRIDEITLYLRDVGKDLKVKLPEVLDRFAKIEAELEGVVKENRKPLHKTILSANKFFQKGGDSFQKLDKFFESMGKSQIELEFSGQYMSKDDYVKNMVALNYIPSPNKYYMLEVVSRDDYSRLDEKGDIILPRKHEDSQFLVSAMYGRRYGDLRFRLGLIENTGGVGVDYFFDNDRGKLRTDLYDFNAVNDVRGKSAHLDMTLRYRFLKHLDTYIGVDNILNSKARNLTFGFGLNFIDQDMKYLLGTVSGAGTYLK